MVAERNHPVNAGGWPQPGRGVWLSVFLLGMCALVNLYSTQPILRHIAEWADVTGADAARTVSYGTLGVAAMAPFAGALSDRLGRKKVMLVAIAALAIGALLSAVASSFEILLLLRFVQGLATPFVFAVAVAYVADEYSPPDAVVLNSVYMAGMAFGGLTGRLLAGATVEATDSWRMAFVPLAIVPTLALIVIAFMLPSERRFAPSAGLGASVRGLGLHVRDWRVLLTCVVGTGLLFQQVGSFTFASLHMQEAPYGLSPLQVSFVFVVMIFPTVVTPWAGRQIREHGVLKAYLAAMTVSAAGMVLLLVPHIAAAISGLALSCVAVVAGQSCATRFIASYAVTARSAAVGLYLTAFYLGGTLAVTIASPVDARYGLEGVVYVIMAAILVGVVASILGWRGVTSGRAASTGD